MKFNREIAKMRRFFEWFEDLLTDAEIEEVPEEEMEILEEVKDYLAEALEAFDQLAD